MFGSDSNLCFSMGQSDGECLKFKKFQNNILVSYGFAAKSTSCTCRFQQPKKKQIFSALEKIVKQQFSNRVDYGNNGPSYGNYSPVGAI